MFAIKHTRSQKTKPTNPSEYIKACRDCGAEIDLSDIDCAGVDTCIECRTKPSLERKKAYRPSLNPSGRRGALK